jgi:hemolysin activation/secretion protein
MFSIAVRGGGAAVTGEADYYHMARIGGFVNLRGYERERFYGKTSFYNNNELRWFIPTKNYFFNGKIGLMTFYDQGRVWQPLEVSNKWHSGYGGGLILVPFNLVALTATYGVSEEAKILQLKVGMFF